MAFSGHHMQATGYWHSTLVSKTCRGCEGTAVGCSAAVQADRRAGRFHASTSGDGTGLEAVRCMGPRCHSFICMLQGTLLRSPEQAMQARHLSGIGLRRLSVGLQALSAVAAVGCITQQGMADERRPQSWSTEGLPGVMPAAVASAASAASLLRRGTRPASELRTGTPSSAFLSPSTEKAWLSPRDALRMALGASCSDQSGAWASNRDLRQASHGSPHVDAWHRERRLLE